MGVYQLLSSVMCHAAEERPEGYAAVGIGFGTLTPDSFPVLAMFAALVTIARQDRQPFPSTAPAKSYAAADGLSAEQVRHVIKLAAGRLPLASATLTSYDPGFDPADRMRQTALDLLQILAGAARTTDAGPWN